MLLSHSLSLSELRVACTKITHTLSWTTQQRRGVRRHITWTSVSGAVNTRMPNDLSPVAKNAKQNACKYPVITLSISISISRYLQLSSEGAKNSCSCRKSWRAQRSGELKASSIQFIREMQLAKWLPRVDVAAASSYPSLLMLFTLRAYQKLRCCCDSWQTCAAARQWGGGNGILFTLKISPTRQHVKWKTYFTSVFPSATERAIKFAPSNG